MNLEQEVFKPQNKAVAQILKEIMWIAGPAVGCIFMQLFQESINMGMIGLLNDNKILAGVGIANAMINIFGMAFFMGLNGAICTLAS